MSEARGENLALPKRSTEGGIKQSIKEFSKRSKESRIFHRSFPTPIGPSGLLIPPGEQISPDSYARNLMPLGQIEKQMEGILERGSKLSEGEEKKIRGDIVTSLSGTYQWQHNEKEELQLRVTIENPAAYEYLKTNMDFMKAFLVFPEFGTGDKYLDEFRKKIQTIKAHIAPNAIAVRPHRYLKTTAIRAEEEQNQRYLVFDFPQIKEAPGKFSRDGLYIYTKSLKEEETNPKFLRLNLSLLKPGWHFQSVNVDKSAKEDFDKRMVLWERNNSLMRQAYSLVTAFGNKEKTTKEVTDRTRPIMEFPGVRDVPIIYDKKAVDIIIHAIPPVEVLLDGKKVSVGVTEEFLYESGAGEPWLGSRFRIKMIKDNVEQDIFLIKRNFSNIGTAFLTTNSEGKDATVEEMDIASAILSSVQQVLAKSAPSK